MDFELGGLVAEGVEEPGVLAGEAGGARVGLGFTGAGRARGLGHGDFGEEAGDVLPGAVDHGPEGDGLGAEAAEAGGDEGEEGGENRLEGPADAGGRGVGQGGWRVEVHFLFVSGGCHRRKRKRSRGAHYFYGGRGSGGAGAVLAVAFLAEMLGDVGGEDVGDGLAWGAAFHQQDAEIGQGWEAFVGADAAEAFGEPGDGGDGDGEAGEDGGVGAELAGGIVGDAVAAAGSLHRGDGGFTPGAAAAGEGKGEGIEAVGGVAVGGDPGERAAPKFDGVGAVGLVTFGDEAEVDIAVAQLIDQFAAG